MKAAAPELPGCEGKRLGRKRQSVLRVVIFRRKGSRFWQAKITGPGVNKRVTTRTQLDAAAREFAKLAQRNLELGKRVGAPAAKAPEAVQAQFGGGGFLNE